MTQFANHALSYSVKSMVLLSVCPRTVADELWGLLQHSMVESRSLDMAVIFRFQSSLHAVYNLRQMNSWKINCVGDSCEQHVVGVGLWLW